MVFAEKKQALFKQAFTGPAGEFLLASLMDFSGFYKQSFTAADPYQTAFNEGKRAVALHILQQLSLTESDLRELVRGYRLDMLNSNQGDNTW